MSNKELLPCPFCGGEAKYNYSDGYDYIICDECGAKTFGFDKEHAFNEWNKRSYPLDKLEDVAFLLEIQDFVKFCRNASAKDIRKIHDRARDLIANYKQFCEKSCKDENTTCKKNF